MHTQHPPKPPPTDAPNPDNLPPKETEKPK